MTMSGGPTFVHVPFSPPLLLILAFQPILFHTIVTDGHYMLCFIEDFFFQSRAELFDCGVANDMSKVTHLLVCIVLTPSFCFASSVCFDSFKNLILSGFASDWCCFPSRRLPCISICLSIFLFSWDRCLRLSLSLLTLFVIWHSGTTWFKYINAHAKSPLTISCVLYAAMA